MQSVLGLLPSGLISGELTDATAINNIQSAIDEFAQYVHDNGSKTRIRTLRGWLESLNSIVECVETTKSQITATIAQAEQEDGVINTGVNVSDVEEFVQARNLTLTITELKDLCKTINNHQILMSSVDDDEYQQVMLDKLRSISSADTRFAIKKCFKLLGCPLPIMPT